MPGTLVRDANAPELADGTALTATGDGTWTYVPSPGNVSIEMVLGAITGTSVVADFEIQGADDTSATNIVSYGQFPSVDESDDSTTAVMNANVHKKYMRYSAVIAGTSPSVTPTIKVRLANDHRVEQTTADADLT